MSDQDHTKSPATQPYRTTKAAQAVSRRLVRLDLDPSTPLVHSTSPDGLQTFTAAYRCAECRTPHARQLEADLCCSANEITDLLDLDQLARLLGRRLGGI